MLISTRGRYALRVLLDLAENQVDGYIPMKDVANRQDLSLKYIERIMPVLSKNKYVIGVHGKGGGYRLAMKPKDYKIGDILRLAEGDLAPVACLGCDSKPCDRAKDCKTLPMWSEFHKMVNDYFDSITLKDLLEKGKYDI
ncbi:MAG: Rrf2 family transcriptional regulator [Ruminococcus sp.]|nr:Rrf2 family transcriptional regulator [Ruminococcus sp.]